MTTELPQEPQTPQKTGPTFDWITILAIPEFTDNQVSENQIRWWLRSKKTNGLGKHVRKMGGKTYINKPGWVGRWLL